MQNHLFLLKNYLITKKRKQTNESFVLISKSPKQKDRLDTAFEFSDNSKSKGGVIVVFDGMFDSDQTWMI